MFYILKKSIVESAIDIADPILENLGLLLWDVTFQREGTIWKLIYYIDKDGGLTIDDCESFSRQIDPLLDEADFISQSYVLEVSSPGVERVLTRDFHYDFLMGSKLKVGLFKAIDGIKTFVGELVAADSDFFSILLENGTPVTFSKKECASVRQYFEF